VYVLEPSVLSRVPAGKVWSSEHRLFPSLVEEGAPIFAVATTAFWLDIGTPEKYLQANLDALSGRYVTSAVPHPGGDVVLLGEEARVADGARVSSVCLGAGASVEDGASVVRSVLLPDAVVKAEAVVQDSVVGQGTIIESGVRVIGDAVADGQVVTE
jgi:NDP-sugar pyrophosphorylase family protein